ncbi:MAG: alpha/beta hydrolase-fold protein [Ferruginibacter sp.]
MNFTVILNQRMKQLLFLIFFCVTTQWLFAQDTSVKDSKPFILGRIIEMQSVVLSEKRTLNIYLPDGYQEQDSLRYPVIYLLDGSADEDFIHIAGLVQFFNFPWVDVLPKSIVVGIANIDRRRDLTYPTIIEKDKIEFPTAGKSEKFMKFFESELQPYIDRNFKTNASKTIIGQSLGGLFATEVLFKKPYLFNKYIIVSPSLWWDNESLLASQPKVLLPGFTDTVSIFIANGNEGKRMEGDTEQLLRILRSGHRKNIKINFEKFSKENHASILHQAAYNAFIALYKKPANIR